MLHDKSTSATSSLFAAAMPVLSVAARRDMIRRYGSARALPYPRRNLNNVAKHHLIYGNYYATMDRLYLPSLDDAQRDGPPRCVSPMEESDGEDKCGEGMNSNDCLVIDDEITPLDYHVDSRGELYVVVSECLRSHPSLLISSEDVTMTESQMPAAWESLNLDYSLGALEDC